MARSPEEMLDRLEQNLESIIAEYHNPDSQESWTQLQIAEAQTVMAICAVQGQMLIAWVVR